MKRSTRAVHTAWQKYKSWQKSNLEKIRTGQTIRSLGEFKEIYEQSGRRISTIKQLVQYQTSYRTYLTINRQYRARYGMSLDQREARKRSTQELADLLRPEIDRARAEQFALGRSRKETAVYISQFFFGS